MTAQQPPGSPSPFPLIPLLVGFAVLDFMVPSLIFSSDSAAVAMLLGGTVAGQVGLVAIWAVLGPRSWTVRLPASFILVLLLSGLLLVGIAPLEPPLEWSDWVEVARTVLAAPLLLLAVQLPLWIVRMALGCRIVPQRADGPAAAGSRQFGMQHLLGAMTATAVALGLASMGLSTRPQGSIIVGWTWESLLIGCLIISMWSSLWTLPSLWAGLGTENTGIGLGATAVYVPLATFAWLLLMGLPGGGLPLAEVAMSFLLLHASLAAVMVATLRLARLRGYVLVRARRRRPVGMPAQQTAGLETVELPPAADQA